jgi:hypothetical protein
MSGFYEQGVVHALSLLKLAELTTPAQVHQDRTVEKLLASHGVVAIHGTGTGKTRTAIQAIDAIGNPARVVVPAALRENFHKEVAKHTTGPFPETNVQSYEKAVSDGKLGPVFTPNETAVFDEAQRGRNAGTSTSELLRQAQQARDRLLLTATPLYNNASDIAPLINAARGQDTLPTDPQKFNKQFIGTREVDPGLLRRIFGADMGHEPALINRQRLVDAAKGYVDVHSNTTDGFPAKEEHHIDVPMSDRQYDTYRYHEDALPFWTRWKIKANLPLSKAESNNLNMFNSGLRQAANTPRAYDASMTDDDEEEHSPKLRAIADNIAKMKAADPNYRGLVYSNYLDAGLNPVHRMLARRGIQAGLFHGGVNEADRKALVEQYNNGQLPVLMVSGAGAEGLDLKGTKHIAIAESHFNDARLQQVRGRGVRYQSHAHLPPEEQNVRIEQYHSTRPKGLVNRIFGTEPDMAIDRYLYNRANEKNKLFSEIQGALQEASDAGPLPRA